MYRFSLRLVALFVAISLWPANAEAQLGGNAAQIKKPLAKPVLMPISAPPIRPERNALLIILENGGIVDNLDPAVRSKLNTNVTFAKCGNFDLPMKQGEAIGAMLGRLAGQIANNAGCINPFAWQMTTMKLSKWVDDQTDKMLEDTIKGGNSILSTQRRYDRVVVMEDADASLDRVIARMKELAPDYVLDVHVLTHGGDEYFVGYRGAQFNDNNFFGILRNEQRANRPMFILAVYQMNCSSGTLKDNWASVGAVAVNGTNGSLLNSMPWQYFHFMGNWINDRDSFATSTITAANEAAFYTTPVYAVFGVLSKVDESKLTVSAGSNGNIRVN
ncbi:MAG: hypothetical protein WBO17_00920 [Sphingorhabdus sp.]